MSRALAREAVRCCRALAEYSEQPGRTTRTFLSPPMRDVHARLGRWMERLGMAVRVDHAGNIRGVHAASCTPAPRLFIGSVSYWASRSSNCSMVTASHSTSK
jgi:allantoate deiminase